MSTLNVGTVKTDTIKTSADVEVYTCKAWVNFNGTGTVAIRASGNVSSITDNGTGDYTVNFTNAMPDENYCTTIGQERLRASAEWGFIGAFSVATSSVRLTSRNTSGTATDFQGVNVVIFR